MASSKSPPPSAPSTRQVFSLKDKLYIKELAATLPKRNRYETVRAIFKERHNRILKRNTFFGIMRHQGLKEPDAQFSSYQLKSKRIGYPSKYPDLEKLLRNWLHKRIDDGKAVTVPIVVEEAKVLYKQNLLSGSDAEVPKFSDYWCRTFLKRSGYQFKSVSGQRVWVKATTIRPNQSLITIESSSPLEGQSSDKHLM
jgi:hypothetical protein